MIQTYIINQPRPWKVFFDSFGHLHLHAASITISEGFEVISEICLFSH